MSSERGLVAPVVLVAAVVLVAVAVAGLIVVINSEDEPPPETGGGEYEVRAIGDSVTAGWGYFPDGGKVHHLLIPRCIPPRTPNGLCQSPRKIAYPAVFASRRGIPLARPGFENLAVAGADPIDWLQQPFSDELERVVADDPDLTVLTLGANPLLTNFLNPVSREGRCVRTERVRECIDDALRDHEVVERLSQVYQRLLDTPDDGRRGLVVVFQYHQTSPGTVPPDRVEILFGKLEEAISAAVARARQERPGDADRLLLIEPPSFDGHQCHADDPWVLDTDTCIHPSAAGQLQFALALEAAVPD